jgi:ribose/xylose/arabinose/galactoside ABC-type transport system permease subunit
MAGNRPKIQLRHFADVQSFGLMALLIVMIAVLSFASPYFLTVGNIVNILLSVSVIGTMAAASTLVLISRNLDLSVASIAALAGVITAEAMGNWGISAGVTILIGLGVGALCGAINGFLINVCRINSIITTIGTLSVFRGAAFVITNGSTALVDNQTLVFIGSGRILGVPVAVWLMLLIYLAVHFVATRTRIGRSLYAIGANPRASMLAGLRLARYRLGVFVASGLSCGLAGILLNGQSGTAMPGAAVSYELLVVTAVLLGGTSLQGGEGRVGGTLLGVLIIGTLNNGMTLLSVPSYYQTVANGILLLIAVGIDQLRRGTGREEVA